MSGRRVAWVTLTGLAVVVVALVGIDWMWMVAPVPAPPVTVKPGPPGAQSSPAPVAVPALDKELTFEFTDHGQTRSVTCTVRRQDFERELDWFGVDPHKFWPSVNSEIQARLESEARSRGVAHLFTFTIKDEASLLNCCHYSPARDPALAKRAQDFIYWIRKAAPGVRDGIVKAAYRRRGFLFDGQKNELSVDYETIIRNATGPLADCFQALRRAGAGSAKDRLADLFVAFFQSLTYESPRDPDERGRKTLDFRVPTAVLVEKAGDCDSKAAAFCAMWRQLPARSVIAMDRRRKHIVVGVEGRPRPGQLYKLIDNRYYVFYEAASPGEGRVTIPGYFEHLVIEPAGSK